MDRGILLDYLLTNTDEQEILDIHNDLAKIPERKNPNPKINYWKILASGIVQKMAIISFGLFFVMATVGKLFYDETIFQYVELYGVICILSFCIWVGLSLYKLIKNQPRTKNIQEIKKENTIKNGLQTVIDKQEAAKLSKKYKKENLKFVKEHIDEVFIPEWEMKRKNILNHFLIIYSVFSVVFIMYFSVDISYQDFKNNWLSIFKDCFFLAGFLAIILKFWLEESWRSLDTEYNRYKFILKKACDLAEKKETDRDNN